MSTPLVNSCILHDRTQGIGIPAPVSQMKKLRPRQRYLQSYNLRFSVTQELSGGEGNCWGEKAVSSADAGSASQLALEEAG